MTRLFGIETEYALAAFDAAGARLDSDLAIETLMRRARRRLCWLPDGGAQGMFLANGARFYVDCGAHPELTTPECSSPSEVVRYVRAGEAILTALAAERDDARVASLRVFRGNVDYSGSGATWGCHASYMHRADRALLPAQLVPHLASRIVYTGAGGFENESAGLAFTLSPRVAHIRREVSAESTSSRGIFHDKREDLSNDGSRRMHEICGDSVGSALAMWLRVGCTALVVALCEMGVRPGDAVALDDAVAAMRLFAADPTCTATALTKTGAHLRAIDIQRHYLEQVEAHARAPQMPSWTDEACRRWRAVLDVVESGWPNAATTLEWAIKLALYRERARRHGIAWESLPAWTTVAQRLAKAWAHSMHAPFTAEAALASSSPIAAAVRRQNAFLSRSGLDWNQLAPFLALRNELFEIDTRFGELGPDGLFTRLHAAGLLTDGVPDVGDVMHATEHPPDGSRARIRGELVRRLAPSRDDRYACNWHGVWDRVADTWVDLGDPFATAATWKARAAPPPEPLRPAALDARDRLLLTRRWRRYRGAADVADARAVATSAVHQRSVASVAYRRRGALGEAERLLVESLELEEALSGTAASPRAHRHNDLALIVMRTGRLLEASAVNAVAWSFNGGRHDVTSARILFTRVAVRLLLGDDDVAVPLGQLKTLLDDRPLHCPREVERPWNIPDVLVLLNEQLVAADAALLQTIARALDDTRHVRELASHARWAAATPRPLDEPWPHRATLTYEPRGAGGRTSART